MNKIELERRTKEFSLILIRFLESLPKNYLGETLGRQLLKSGTSIGANYREANRAESKADFIHKLAIVEKEASETLYWLELMLEGGIGANQEGYKAYAGSQATVGHIYSGRANIERTQMISNLKFRNPKSMSSQI
jgi:four helix bundle protein